MTVLEEIRARIKEDKALSDSLREAKTAEEVLSILQSAGFELSLDEVKAMAKSDDVELSDDALESISGGSMKLSPPLSKLVFQGLKKG